LPKTIGALDLVLCSSALRTRETAELALAGFGRGLQVLFEDQLYLANQTILIGRLSQIDEPVGSVMVIGHNPGLHELALALAAPGSAGYKALADGKFPTGVRASFAVATRWSAIEGERHRLVDYVTVKSLGGKD
jgi:phosphohistidine phosphatase